MIDLEHGVYTRGERLLIQHAVAAIFGGLESGVGKHNVDSFLNEPVAAHIGCMMRHAGQLLKESVGYCANDGEDHAVNMACRALMALVCLKQGGKMHEYGSNSTSPITQSIPAATGASG